MHLSSEQIQMEVDNTNIKPGIIQTDLIQSHLLAIIKAKTSHEWISPQETRRF